MCECTTSYLFQSKDNGPFRSSISFQAFQTITVCCSISFKSFHNFLSLRIFCFFNCYTPAVNQVTALDCSGFRSQLNQALDYTNRALDHTIQALDSISDSRSLLNSFFSQVFPLPEGVYLEGSTFKSPSKS